MATRPHFRPLQDNPPPGGYPSFDMRRKIGRRGPPGWMIWLGIATSTWYGFHMIGKTNSVKRKEHKEKREARIAVAGYLQAEFDRNLSKSIAESNKREAEIMKNVDGWKVGESVYSKRWQPPTSGLSK